MPEARKYLVPEEVKRLAAAARLTRHGHRDATMIKVAYKHGLRATELVNLRRDQVDLEAGLLHVRRRKNGTPSTHPIDGEELRALRKLIRDAPEGAYVFLSAWGGPMTERAFHKIVAAAGVAAGLPMPAHPHQLRHGCGYKLAADGRDTRAIQLYLGHRNIAHTALYTALSPDRFKGFWKD